MQKATVNSVKLEKGDDFHTAKIDLAGHTEAIVVYGNYGEELDSRVNTILEAFNAPRYLEELDNLREENEKMAGTIQRLRHLILNSGIEVEDILNMLY